MDSKKEKERFIIEKFKVSSPIDFKILDYEKARSIFKDYNNDNPDFIILKGTDYIGAELFQLSLNKTEQLVYQFDDAGRKIKNLPHRATKFPISINNSKDLEKHTRFLKTHGLVPSDDIEKVLIERINSKIKRLHEYLTYRVWLLGYATEYYQTGMVENIYRDGIGDNLRQSIPKIVNIPDKIEKIFLFETGTSDRDFIFELQ